MKENNKELLNAENNFNEYEEECASIPVWISLNELGKIKFYDSVDNVKIINRAIKLINLIFYE